MAVRVKPKLYIPDYVGYGTPFKDEFEIVYKSQDMYSIEEMKKCDFLMLTGGADIHPKYYGHHPSVRTQAWEDSIRDFREAKLGEEAIAADIPIIGICRGAQWLTILAGGSLIQHVTNHSNGSHLMHTEDGQILDMPSLHHQMCNLNGLDKVLLAWTKNLSTLYLGDKDQTLYPKGMAKEPEVFYLPAVRGFGIQGHPEFISAAAPANVYLREQIKEIYQL